MINIKTINVTPISQHCRVLWCEKTSEATIVDPGGSGKEIAEFIKNQKLIPKSIWLTHSHFDHCGGVATLKKIFPNIKLYAHSLEKNMREEVVNIMEMFCITDKSCQNCPEPEVFLEDNLVLAVGEEKFITFFTPGHSLGGCSFYNENNKILISGDTLFAGTIGRTDLFGGDHEAILKSIREKLFVLPDDTIVYPGHGENTTILSEKLDNQYFN